VFGLPRLSLPRVVIVLAAVVVGYLLFSAAGDLLLAQRLNRDEERLQDELVDLERQHRELTAIREYLQTDEYIERVARETLGWVRPGETLVIVSSSVTPTPTPEKDAPDQARPWWEAIYQP